jgi:hypothetical protein
MLARVLVLHVESPNNQARIRRKFQVKQFKGGGQLSTILDKSNGKKCIGHIAEPYLDIMAISYIPCWMEIEGMRHMTEGRHVDDSSSSERS